MFEEKRDIETMKQTTTLGGEVSQLLTKITELSQKLDQQNNTQQMGPCPNCVKYQQLMESTEQGLRKFNLQKPQSYLESDDINEELKWDQRINKDEALHQKMNEMSKEMKIAQEHNSTLTRQARELEEKVSHLTAQLVAYKEDFENERRDRERAQGTISELRIQIQQIEQLQLRMNQRSFATIQPSGTPLIGATHYPEVQNSPYPPVTATRHPTTPATHYSVIGSYTNSNDNDVVVDSDDVPFTARCPQPSRGSTQPSRGLPQPSRGSQPVAGSQPSRCSRDRLQARGPVYQCDGGPNRTATDGEDTTPKYTPTCGTLSPARGTTNNQISVKSGAVCVNSLSGACRGNDVIQKSQQGYHRYTRDDFESDHAEAKGTSDSNGHSNSDNTLSCPICHKLFHHLDHYQLLLHMEQHASRSGSDATIST